ncbi:MAG TPA: IclR family transcriptional regulator [Enteractinococcus helveticum]|uniref:IclR family transcriptional regulator n=1 Tax=Enteractinococcus helveticum TaxID=1837282 RepID=A0A921K882_9MICC|nr:IclR family transcriptional regulator [Enteractinococcus helveticum]HJF15502.1 IclR family transcriptional regulator [Enteractinococcus helveticum]
MSVLQTGARTLDVVQLVASRGEVSVTEVAGALQISPSMAHRLLNTCLTKGFLRQDFSGGPYSVGGTLRQIADDVNRDKSMRAVLAPLLRKATRELSESCSIAVLEGRNIRFLLSEESPNLVTISTPIRRVAPAFSTAAGRALLATLDDADIEALFRDMDWETKTASEVHNPQGVHSFSDLQAELQRTRQRGWAVQAGESQVGMAAVAMALVDGAGVGVASVTVTVPQIRLHKRSDAVALVNQLRPHQQQMQKRLAR